MLSPSQSSLLPVPACLPHWGSAQSSVPSLQVAAWTSSLSLVSFYRTACPVFAETDSAPNLSEQEGRAEGGVGTRPLWPGEPQTWHRGLWHREPSQASTGPASG